MHKILESKREARKGLAARPFSEKVKLLEKLRDRSLAIAASPLRRDYLDLLEARAVNEDKATDSTAEVNRKLGLK
jgi:hypothetical protein